MVWTKATFWLVADILRNEVKELEQPFIEPCSGLETVGNIAIEFANAFQKSNPRFDRAKFIRACGLEA